MFTQNHTATMLALQSLGSSVFSETVHVHVHTVGYGMNSNMGADGWTPVQTVPDDYVCPAVVNKYNWDTAAAGVHAEASDEFYLRQTGNSIQVKKKLEEGAPVEFGLNLAFPCVKGAVQDTQCQTLVIGGSFDAGITVRCLLSSWLSTCLNRLTSFPHTHHSLFFFSSCT